MTAVVESITHQVLLTVYLALATVQPPDLAGHVTYYTCPPYCNRMSNGEWYEADGLTVAVDISEWDELANQCLLVMPDATDEWITLTVADTGYLYYYSEGWSDPITLDLPELTFEMIAPEGAGMFKAKAWIVPEQLCRVKGEDYETILREDG